LRKLQRDLKVLYYFYLEVSARKCAHELGVDYETVSKRYAEYREAIVEFLDAEFKKLCGKIEADESYFGGKRKGNRDRGAFNKQAVFGVLERDGRVYTAVVADVSAKTLFEHIQRKTRKGSVFYTDDFKSYKDLKQYGKHSRIKHSKSFGKGHTTSTASKAFGRTPKNASTNTTASTAETTFRTLKKWSSGSTTETSSFTRCSYA